MHVSRSARIFLAILICIIYSNIFVTPWQLDDLPNIVDNSPLHIDNLMPETIRQTLFALPFNTGTLYRPVPMLSLALNWYMGQDNPLGYHVVNVLIHILTAFFLYQAILLLFRTPRLKKYSCEDAQFVALLATILWAIHPIQIQAVTYIVQRMTSLAAMFYIWALIWYLRARFSRTPSSRSVYLLFSLFCYVCAVGSKENAVLLPLGLLLLEITFFTGEHDQFSRNIRLILSSVSAVIVLAGCYFVISNNYLENFFTPFESRPFSLYERLLTQPRIIFLYLSLILYPLPSRFSIDHDIVFSTSLYYPWTTVAALAGIAILIVAGFALLRRSPLLGFAILFFLLNHLVESTILPLELIFEHRNYLPSVFLFVPVAFWLLQGLRMYATRNRIVYGTILIFIPLLLLQVGLGTYLRNNLWSSRETLWLDALHKAPNSARAQSYLGLLYGFYKKEQSAENMQTALAHLQMALTGNTPRVTSRAETLGNIGGVYFNYGEYDNAIEFYEKSLAIKPDFNKFRFQLASALSLQGKFAQALAQTDIILESQEPSNAVYNLRGQIFLWMQRPEKAIEAIRTAMRLSGPYRHQSFCNMGIALSKAGYYKQAEWFLLNALKNSPRDHIVLFSLVENSGRAGKVEEALRYGRMVFYSFPIPFIQQSLDKLKDDYRTAPVDAEIIRPVLREVGKELITPQS